MCSCYTWHTKLHTVMWYRIPLLCTKVPIVLMSETYTLITYIGSCTNIHHIFPPAHTIILTLTFLPINMSSIPTCHQEKGKQTQECHCSCSKMKIFDQITQHSYIKMVKWFHAMWSKICCLIVLVLLHTCVDANWRNLEFSYLNWGLCYCSTKLLLDATHAR